MIIVRGPGERIWHVPKSVDLDDTDHSLSRSSWHTLCGSDFESKTAEIARRRPDRAVTCPTCWHIYSARPAGA